MTKPMNHASKQNASFRIFTKSTHPAFLHPTSACIRTTCHSFADVLIFVTYVGLYMFLCLFKLWFAKAKSLWHTCCV